MNYFRSRISCKSHCIFNGFFLWSFPRSLQNFHQNPLHNLLKNLIINKETNKWGWPHNVAFGRVWRKIINTLLSLKCSLADTGFGVVHWTIQYLPLNIQIQGGRYLPKQDSGHNNNTLLIIVRNNKTLLHWIEQSCIYIIKWIMF